MSRNTELEVPILNKMLEKVKVSGNTTSESGIGMSPEIANKKAKNESPLAVNNIQE